MVVKLRPKKEQDKGDKKIKQDGNLRQFNGKFMKKTWFKRR